MKLEKTEVRDNKEALRTNELLERSERVMDSAIELLSELDGTSTDAIREKLAEDMSEPTELQKVMELETAKENLRVAREGAVNAQVSFGQTVEERCKINEIKNAIENGNKIATEHRTKELGEMLKKQQEQKEKREREEREKKERQEKERKAREAQKKNTHK